MCPDVNESELYARDRESFHIQSTGLGGRRAGPQASGALVKEPGHACVSLTSLPVLEASAPSSRRSRGLPKEETGLSKRNGYPPGGLGLQCP